MILAIPIFYTNILKHIHLRMQINTNTLNLQNTAYIFSILTRLEKNFNIVFECYKYYYCCISTVYVLEQIGYHKLSQ